MGIFVDCFLLLRIFEGSIITQKKHWYFKAKYWKEWACFSWPSLMQNSIKELIFGFPYVQSINVFFGSFSTFLGAANLDLDWERVEPNLPPKTGDLAPSSSSTSTDGARPLLSLFLSHYLISHCNCKSPKKKKSYVRSYRVTLLSSSLIFIGPLFLLSLSDCNFNL